jgi:hypothetical protein
MVLKTVSALIVVKGCSSSCNPATWRTRGSKVQEENAGHGINGRGPCLREGTVYAVKARILFLRRARAEPLANGRGPDHGGDGGDDQYEEPLVETITHRHPHLPCSFTHVS